VTPIDTKPMILPTTAPTIVKVFGFGAASAAVDVEEIVGERTMDVMTDPPIVITTAEGDTDVKVVIAGIPPLVKLVEVLVVDDAAPDVEDAAVLEVDVKGDGEVVNDEPTACITEVIENPPVELNGVVLAELMLEVAGVGSSEVTTA